MRLHIQLYQLCSTQMILDRHRNTYDIFFNSTSTKDNYYESPLFILGNNLYSLSLFKLKINKHIDDIN